MDKQKLWKSYLLVWIVLTVVFVGLYHPFLFGGQMYAYEDVGADTIDQYLAAMVYETNQIREGIVHGYDLQYGLGRYTGGYVLKYLNPVNLPILLLGEEYLHIALLISMYLKYTLIGLFALIYFLRVLKNEKASIICALLWTFSGYAVLWGQHYHFLTAILGFTAAVLGFQLYLEESRYRYLVIPAVALLAMTSYYHLYIACFFFLGYGMIWLAARGEKVGSILKKAVGFLLCMVPALLLAGESLFPAVANFFASFRVEQVTLSAEMSLLYSENVLMAFIARFLSNDLIGTGDLFLGPTNYYECAILHVSILSVFAFCYLLTGKHRVSVLLITLGCTAMLCMPVVSQTLVFSTATQRWTYLLSFVQVIAIGFCLKDIFQTWGQKNSCRRMGIALLMSDGILLVFGGILYRYHMRVGGWLLNKNACVILVLIIFGYHCVFFLMEKWRTKAFALLLAAVAAELLLGNYTCVNERDTISVSQWREEMYYDGTQQAIEWIQQHDEGVYRINKTYSSVDDCDALIQEFNGVSIYNSTNSAELLNLARSFGYSEAGNHVSFDGTDLLANTMLGVKYVIARSGEVLNPVYYEKVYDNGTSAVYENRYWLGFGYVYQQGAPQQEVLSDTSLETALRMSEAYFLTEKTGEKSEAKKNAIDLMPYLVSEVHCVYNNENVLTVTGTDLGMKLIFELPELPANMLVGGVRIEMTAEASAAVCLLTANEGAEFVEGDYDIVYYRDGSGVYYLDTLTSMQPDRIRLDLSWVPQTITISSLELILVDEEALQNNLVRLQQNRITDMVQTGNTLSCTVDNSAQETAMLCVPLLYSENWTASVDGQAVEVVNINGGLVGVIVPPGEHRVSLEYAGLDYQIGIVTSCVSLVLIFVIMYLDTRHRKHKKSINEKEEKKNDKF